jgi:hypothetical protein
MTIHGESIQNPELTLLDKLVREATALRHRYEADACIWQALTNLGVKNQGERTRLFKQVKTQLAKRETEGRKQQKMFEQELAEVEKAEMMRDAYRHEKSQPPDTYSVVDDEDENP